MHSFTRWWNFWSITWWGFVPVGCEYRYSLELACSIWLVNHGLYYSSSGVNKPETEQRRPVTTCHFCTLNTWAHTCWRRHHGGTSTENCLLKSTAIFPSQHSNAVDWILSMSPALTLNWLAQKGKQSFPREKPIHSQSCFCFLEKLESG